MQTADHPVSAPQLTHECVVAAGDRYGVPIPLIYAILHKEGGKAGVVSRNKDGSFDMGPVQINSSWLPALSKYGISAAKLTWDSCINVHIGAWILRSAKEEVRDWTKAIMAYNVGTRGIERKRTAAIRYAKDVITYWHHYHKLLGYA